MCRGAVQGQRTRRTVLGNPAVFLSQRSHALLCCSLSTCKMNVQQAKAWNNNIEGLDAEKKSSQDVCSALYYKPGAWRLGGRAEAALIISSVLRRRQNIWNLFQCLGGISRTCYSAWHFGPQMPWRSWSFHALMEIDPAELWQQPSLCVSIFFSPQSSLVSHHHPTLRQTTVKLQLTETQFNSLISKKAAQSHTHQS